MDSLSSLLYSCAFILLLNPLTCFCSQGDGVEAKEDHHVVSVQSLLPNKDVCSPSKESDPSKLEVVHRHGPCSPLKHKPKPTHKKILDDDQHRVDWLRRQASGELATISNRHGRPGSLPGTKIPARDGLSLGSGNYIISVGFGTPKITQSVVFDTGSDITWIQCQPCASVCYQQQDALFDPSKSSTYRNISCASKFCSALDASGCAGSTCLYAVQYGDSSFTVGFFAQETLTLAPSYVIPNFRFGCGEKNNGLFGQVAGLLGLGRRRQVSMVSQAAQKIGNVFSYCLPSTTSSTGYLTFGQGSTANVRYTPMLSSSDMPTFYLLELMSISVGRHKLPISPVVFSKARTIIDSGTVITRLPPTAYAALRTAFRAQMKRYPAAPAASILDTCYDLSKSTTVRIPAVAMEYRGSTTVSLDPSGIMYLVNAKQACLAFAPNGDDTDMVIVGNTQQRRLNVVYDVGRKLIGFGAGSC